MASVHPSKVIRTPDEAFIGLPNFNYVPSYAHYGNLRYAFIDEQSPFVLHGGEAVPLSQIDNSVEIHWETYLCLHGQPTWSFLFRRMIPLFLNRPAPQGTPLASKYIRRRVLAPDFIGFGRSDKPVDDSFYTWDMHHSFLTNFVRTQILDQINVFPGSVAAVVQDWGGILGLTLPSLFPKLFTHLLVMNTAFGLGNAPSKGWLQFRDFIKKSPDVAIGPLLGRGTKHLTEAEKSAYDAPYTGQASKAGVRRFPQLVPITKSMAGVASSHAAYTYFRRLLPEDLRVFVAIGMSDPVLGERVMETGIVPAFESSTGCLVMKVQEAGHFVQEWGEDIAEAAIKAWAAAKDEDVQMSNLTRRYKTKDAKL